MFVEPTMNDFLDNIRGHLKKAADRSRVAVAGVNEQLTKAGRLGSAAAFSMICDAVRKEYDAGIVTALFELKRCASDNTKLDRLDLRQATMQCLDNFAIELKAITEPDQYPSIVRHLIDAKFREFDQHLAFVVHQFDVGFLLPTEPPIPNVSNNSINIGSMHGSAIQQGSPHATQQLKLDTDQVRAASTEQPDDLPPGVHVFPVPPREPWHKRSSTAIKTAEFAVVLACAGVAWSLGGELTLTVIALFVGWALGSVSIIALPDRSVAVKSFAIAALFLFLSFEGGFLYWHFHANQGVGKEVSPSAWMPLTKEAQSQLTNSLRAIPAQTIAIACETIDCKALSDDLVASFLSAGWSPQVYHGGGIGISGRTGLFIDPDEAATQRIRLAIQGTTDLKVIVGPDTRNAFGNGPIYLIIGAKPF